MNKKLTKEYFAQVVDEEKDMLFRLAQSVLRNTTDSEDAVSEAILIAWEKRENLNDVMKLRSWLITIVLNKAKWMASRRKKEIPTDNIIEMTEQSESMEQTDNIWDYIMNLEEKHRVIIILYYYREFSVNEISKILHIPIGTVKSRLSRARESLREQYEEGVCEKGEQGYV